MTLPGLATPIPDGVPPRPAPQTRTARVIMGLGLLGAFLPLVWADSVGLWGAGAAVWLLPVALLLSGAAGSEGAAILARRGLGPRPSVLIVACVAVPSAAAFGSPAFRSATGEGAPLDPAGWASAAAVAAMMLAFLVEMIFYRPGDRAIERLAGTALGLLMIALPMAFVVSLRLTGTPDYEGGWHRPGLAPLVGMIAAVKFGDVLAYLVGSTVGRHRMAPTLSPGKTWEGAAGSLCGALLASWIVFVVLRGVLAPDESGRAVPFGGWIVHGLLVGSAGMLGDLAESLVKREAGVKDSGGALGALGGGLDLVDSLLFAAPTAWLLWVLSAPS